MSRPGRNRSARFAQLAAFAALAVAPAAGCGGGGATSTQGAAPATSTERSTTVARPPSPGGGGGEPGSGGRSQRTTPKPPRPHPERPIKAAVSAYISALDGHDGARLCALLAPGALDGVELPERAGTCAASLDGSIGYRDPRGRFPVWRSTRIRGFRTIRIGPSLARATVTVVTLYAGNRQASIEDDVVFLDRSGGSWLLAQPSVTFYRAIGVADVPPQVLAPP